MLNAILRAARDVRSNVSGAAAMMAALSLPVLIGCAGLAVDTAQWFLWKRELQHSVDQAAIGAAWALSNDIMKGQYETRGRQEFNANLAVTKDFAEQPSFALANYAGGTDNSVIVSARARKKLPFSSVIMGRPVTINVRAQASFQEGGSYNACLIALTDESNALDIGGNANVNARCGLAALSCEDDLGRGVKAAERAGRQGSGFAWHQLALAAQGTSCHVRLTVPRISRLESAD